jgi:hypothetical protein
MFAVIYLVFERWRPALINFLGCSAQGIEVANGVTTLAVRLSGRHFELKRPGRKRLRTWESRRDVQAERVVIVHDPQGALAVRRTASKDNPEACKASAPSICCS